MKTTWILFSPLLIPTLVEMMSPVPILPWQRMWSVAIALYATAKGWSVATASPPLRGGTRLAFLLGWPGMDPGEFRTGAEGLPSPLPRMVRNVFFGSILLAVAAPLLQDDHPILATWAAMTGLIFNLHFGIFHGLARFWNLQGFATQPLMRSPAAARSLSEFWGQRWNRAFQRLVHRFVFLPLRRRMSGAWALAMGFLFSGLVHELVISVPAGGGYGCPTAYFLLQGAGVLLERRWPVSRLRTLAIVLLPMPLLFPPVFIRNVMLPMFIDWGVLTP